MPSDPIWWWAFGVQLLALPGALLPVLPSLLWLPLGAGLWVWHVGWAAGWPTLVLALTVFFLGFIADLLAVALASARLRASRWAVLGAGLGLLLGFVGLLPALPFGGPLLGALFGPWLGAALVEAFSATRPPLALGWLSSARRGALVGLAVVAGLLVSRVAQIFLALLGIGGFLLLTWH